MHCTRAAFPLLRWRLPLAVVATGAAVVVVPSPPAQAETMEVSAADLAFSPATISVRLTGNEPGQAAPHAHVIWTMADPGTEHTVTFDDPRLVSSGPLPSGQRHEALIYATGTYGYRCTIHPAMTGRVVVLPEPPPAPTTAAQPPPGSTPLEPDPAPGAGPAPFLIAVAVLTGLAGLLWLLLRGRRMADSEPPD